MPNYVEPQRGTTVVNQLVTGLAKLGISVLGTRVLSVRGRNSGEWRSTPVNLLIWEGQRYLVAPRGVTQWVRNLRVAGEGQLRVGKRVERFVSAEVPDDDKPPVLRAYLRRWKFEVGLWFSGINATSPESELRRIAPRYPVFRITTAQTS